MGKINVAIRELKGIVNDAEFNLENPGNEDDTLQQIISRADRIYAILVEDASAKLSRGEY